MTPIPRELIQYPRVVRDEEKTPTLGGREWRYMLFVEWADGERTVLHSERSVESGCTYYRTDGRYEVGSQMPSITATDKKVLLSKISRRWAEICKAREEKIVEKEE